MKVLTATIANWLCVWLGALGYRVGDRFLAWSDAVEDWAGIGPEFPEGIWMVGSAVRPDYLGDEYKVGGTTDE